MKTISAQLLADLQSGEVPWAVLLEVERVTDGKKFYFTDNDEPLSYGGNLYVPGIADGRAQQRLGLSATSLSAQVIINDQEIVESDLIAGHWDNAKLKVMAINRAAPANGDIKGLRGRLGKVSDSDTLVTAEVRSLLDALRQSRGRTYDIGCPYDLGDADCGVNLTPFTATGTVTAVTDQRTFTTSLTAAAGTYDLGLLTWTSGVNIFLKRQVKAYTLPAANGVIELTRPMAVVISPGDAFSVSQGCLKTQADCTTRYNNFARFGGFPFIPGQTQILKTGSQ